MPTTCDDRERGRIAMMIDTEITQVVFHKRRYYTILVFLQVLQRHRPHLHIQHEFIIQDGPLKLHQTTAVVIIQIKAQLYKKICMKTYLENALTENIVYYTVSRKKGAFSTITIAFLSRFLQF